MNITLKDCPVCGGPGSIYVHEGAIMKIGCKTCDLAFSKCYAPDGKPVPAEEFYKVRDELIEKWNTRSASINTDVDLNAQADGWDWIATTENYKCDNCTEISPEPYKYCPHCKQFMRNYKTV